MRGQPAAPESAGPPVLAAPDLPTLLHSASPEMPGGPAEGHLARLSVSREAYCVEVLPVRGVADIGGAARRLVAFKYICGTVPDFYHVCSGAFSCMSSRIMLSLRQGSRSLTQSLDTDLLFILERTLLSLSVT